MQHKSVLLEEAVDALNIKGDGVYVDATMGYAGHSSVILGRCKKGFLFAFDQDLEAIEFSHNKLSNIGQNFKIIHSNFEHLKICLEKQKITSVDGILFDLGVSSPQIDNEIRGFSFMKDAKLDMRMDQTKKITAEYIVNNYSLEKLVNIFYLYGEEKLSKLIAKKIVDYRITKKIETTMELVSIIKSAVGAKYFNIKHPERNIFQAIRIEVNNELEVIKKVLPDAIKLLNIGGRISIITFHSLEDKIVKKIFKKYSEINEIVKGLPEIPNEYKPLIKLINKKPITPNDEEVKNNPRSRSAKLRIIERI